jgi:chemotaxis protein methyltransferase CheR
MELSHQEYDLLSKYIHELCGLVIPEEKSYLIRQRLEPVAMTEGCESFRELFGKIKSGEIPDIEEQIIDAITTNETSFFRDGHPFDTFRDHILPKLGELVVERKARQITRKGPKVSIWSAGSSTGQEPYTLAMLIHEYASQNPRMGIMQDDFGLLATDVSSRALSRAMAGEYTEMEVRRGLSPYRIEKYFRQVNRRWVISSALRVMVDFRQINLIKPFSILGGFDMILCRNVLIYFGETTKQHMINQLYNMLSDDGYLMLGATENLYGLTNKFKSFHCGKTLLYTKVT